MKTKRLMTLLSGLCVLTMVVGCLLLTIEGNVYFVAATIDILLYIIIMIASIIIMIKDSNLYIPKQNETLSSARMVLLVTTLAIVVLIVTVFVSIFR